MEHRQTIGNTAFPELHLVERALDGDGEAFGELVSGLAPRMLSTAHRVVGNWADAEDAVQEALWRAYERLDSFRAESSFSAWLTRITFNEALALLRRRRSRPVLLAGTPHVDGNPPDPSDPRRSAEDNCLSDELTEIVRDAIEEMPPGYRDLMHLWAFGELEYAEIARRLGMSLGVAKSRLYRGRLTLKRLLAARLGRDAQTEGIVA